MSSAMRKPRSTGKHYCRWMIRKDMPDVLRIEAACYEHPYCEDDFQFLLRNRNTLGYVCEVDDIVLGYMIYELQKSKFQVLKLAVDPDHHHEGIGRSLLDYLKHKLNCSRRTRINYSVPESNLDAQLFLKACGFRAVNVLRGFFKDGGDYPEDAYEMVYRHVIGGSNA